MRTFGIEIEMVGKTHFMIAKAVHSVVGGKVKHIIDKEDDSLTHEDISAPDGRVWRVEDDDSLHAPKHLRAELVSPKLTEADLAALGNIVGALAAAGAHTNPYCGIHVHIGAKDAAVEDVCRFIDVMIDEEHKLVKNFNCSPRRLQRFAKLMSPGFIKKFKRRRPKTPEELERLWYGRPADPQRRSDRYHKSRYRGLNLQSWFYRGTIEFRYFDGSLDRNRVEACVKRCLDIANRAGLP